MSNFRRSPACITDLYRTSSIITALTDHICPGESFRGSNSYKTLMMSRDVNKKSRCRRVESEKQARRLCVNGVDNYVIFPRCLP